MRKIIIFLLVIFLISFSNSELVAQDKPPDLLTALSLMDKLIIGYNYSNLVGRDAIHIKYTTGYFVGMSVSVLAGPMTEVVLETAYMGKGAKQNFNNKTYEFKLHSLHEALLLKHTFDFPKSRYFKSFIMAGISASLYGSNGELYIKRHTNTGIAFYQKYEDVGSFTWEGIIGLGIDLISIDNSHKINRKVGLEFRYTFGLQTITKNDLYVEPDIKEKDIILRNSVFSLNFVWYFGKPK